jgi:glycosyltransferase involved in cell wall biosynthesis
VTLTESAARSTEIELPSRPKRPVRRVLQVFHSLGIGGAETWLVAFLEWLASNGDSLPVEVQVDVCLTSGKRAVLDDRIASLGARLHYLRYQGAHLPRFRKDFTRLLAAGQYDAIHDHADFAGGVHLLCGLGELPAARVIHVHNPLATFSGSFRKRLARAVGRQGVERLATTVAGTSMRILREFDLAPDDRRSQRRIALHCGFDLAPFTVDATEARARMRTEFGWDNQDKILLFVGRLTSHFNQKNPQFALDVARECNARDSGVKALFVGAGDEARQQIESELHAEGRDHSIRLTGIRFDVPQLMIAADLLLFPSIAEGLGMVAVEAQAAGLRTLASDTTPVECEVVPGMVTFVSLNEAPSQWARIALGLLDSPAVDRTAARAAVARSSFSIDSSARALLDVYGFVPASSRS